jgi:hypothetical protein
VHRFLETLDKPLWGFGVGLAEFTHPDRAGRATARHGAPSLLPGSVARLESRARITAWSTG